MADLFLFRVKMAFLDDVPPEFYTMLIPVLLGVGLVAITVLAIFWIGAGRQRSFEEAKAQASKRAEEVLKGKEYQNSPRAKKGKRQYPRKPKKGDEEGVGLSLEDTQPLKGILKAAASTAKEATPERSPRNRVEFQLDSPSADTKETPRTSPPTPHPAKQPPMRLQMQPVSIASIFYVCPYEHCNTCIFYYDASFFLY